MLAVGLAGLFAQAGGQAQAPPADALPFAKSYLVTGNYVVGGVDLPSNGQNGFVTGPIPIAGVPANAEILAAFLYWETTTNSPTIKQQADGAKFRGQPLAVVKASSLRPTSATAECFPSGPQSTMTMFRADVLRLLPLQLDTNGRPTGKRLVNDADLVKSGLPRHTVTLPDAGPSTNHAPVSAGATLFVLYQDATQPLTSVVLYDGIHMQGPSETMTQTVRGFYQSSAGHVAKMTHIVGSGKNNKTDRTYFKPGANRPATLVGGDKFANQGQGGNSDRGWSNPTFDVTSLMPGSDAGTGYGEEVFTTVDQTKNNPYECRTWAAIAFSTTVQGYRRRRHPGQAGGRQRAQEAEQRAAAGPARHGRELHAQGRLRRDRRDEGRAPHLIRIGERPRQAGRSRRDRH